MVNRSWVKVINSYGETVYVLEDMLKNGQEYANGYPIFTYCHLTINGTLISPDDIYSVKFIETACDNNISMGETCSNSIEIKIKDNYSLSYDGAEIICGISAGVEIGYGAHDDDGNYYSYTKKHCVFEKSSGYTDDDGFVPFGTFYVSEFEKKKGYITLTAYDKMALLNVEYVPSTSITFPATTKAIVDDIEKQFKITGQNYPNYGYSITDTALVTNISCTVREMLGYVAGLWGANARFNRDNRLEYYFFQPTSNITLDEDIYLDTFEAESDLYTIEALVSGEGEDEIKSGNGKAITFTNPFITQERLDAIVAKRLPYKYYSGSVSFKGNAEYEISDLATIVTSDGTEYTLPIMKQEINFDGGLKSTATSYGMSDNTAIISDFKSETKTLERNVSKIESMQETIIGSNGGCYELLLDESDNNRPYGTAWWKDTSKTAGWKFTYGGLGYFNNNVLQKTAITNDGSVLADNITANSILTNSFTIGKSSSDYAMSFDGSTGKITFGSGVSMSWADITDAPTIPSKTSDLSNDSGYVTSDGVPTKTSELDNDSGYITDGDIPTKTSDLTNDSGYINSITATTITNNAISTASISANQITTGTLSADRVGAGSFYMTGGYINIDSGVDDTNTIRLVGSSRYTEMGPGGVYTACNDGTYRAFIDAQSGFYVGDGSGNSGGLTTEVLSLNGISLYNQYGHFMFSNTVEPEGSFNWDLGSDSYYWNNVYCYSVNQISDKNFKEDITPLATKYVDLFDKLNPVSFKFKGGNRTHTGFIAQDIETAMNEVGLTSSEFAGFYKSADDVCGLRYTEFISLLTAKVQQLEDRIEVLENGQTTND